MAARKLAAPPALSVQEVADRSTWHVENEPTRLNEALAYFDQASRHLAPRDVLLGALNLDYQVDMERMLGLDIDDPRLRLRAIAGRAYERMAEFRRRAAKSARRDNRRTELERLAEKLETERDYRLAPAIAGLRQSVQALQPRVDRLIDPRLDLLWDAGLEADSDREVRSALVLLDLTPEGLPVLNEVAAASYGDPDHGDPEFVAALREVMAGYAVGPVEVDFEDFHVLQLAEIYALSFGRHVPTTYHPASNGSVAAVAAAGQGSDALFLAFIEANFALADMPVTSPEGILRHWRPFPQLRSRLSRLTQLGAAAVSGVELPFYLEERREFGSIGILEDLEAMSSL